ncbi:bifunctional folylpolyglutamate synthase/dihydrofolate synthase [Helicobacter sp. MIT 14-3879]|uniref:bifunctional folylpolyglutamate synthase/dihydrofolate synthase n=1 Tax=Helicobacter sp. MIT 14-3879 TaxID=2040649 RepID=UPI000E1F8B6C|nr:bifunctional folylpolyglutamate synthase/dihydrofolate synthase [Helicobacter sp. MIT 14-3879]RDU65434.1 bifunctional folylpolyglutamate synthase/dihydrofolate synthase [Helicobacter sp. MIT 14-3879]
MNLVEKYMFNKGQEYAKFDKNRAKIIYSLLKPKLKHNFKTIQVLGTNGKGSTGRFLSLALIQNNFNVLHFTSPHIFSFNERFYKNGEIVNYKELKKAHFFLQNFDFINKCSYFEYATFLALTLAQDVDYLILEAGIGGEFDSTSVLHRDMCIFSVIDFDHCEMLGNSIEEIATTKLNAMVNPSIIGIQKHNVIKNIATKIAQHKSVSLYFLDFREDSSIDNYFKKHQLASFLKPNLLLALKAADILGLKYDLTTLKKLDLRGRFERIANNIIIDVGHNQNAALAIKESLKNKKVILVYNSYFQKNIKEILSILKDNILRLEIIEIRNNKRIIKKRDLIEILESLNISYDKFRGIKKDYDYLVFGSFSVVEKFMQKRLK